jgi:ABC-type branched-subunit amino acid transport system ATPase component
LILQLQHITFGFTPDKQIFNDLSFSLEEQMIYALMGSNGAGKTTLFNIITGFIKPQNGEIHFGEKNITNQQPYKINRQGIGRTFQDLRLITKLTVKENIILAMKNNPSDKWYNALTNFKEDVVWDIIEARRPEKILKQFFLSDVENSLAAEISYGQQKLLSLACCVANGASLLLIDEAVAGIQPDYRNKIAIIVKQLKEQGKTILFIEHNTDFITDVAENIFFLHEGKILTFENMETLRNDKQVLNAYI